MSTGPLQRPRTVSSLRMASAGTSAPEKAASRIRVGRREISVDALLGLCLGAGLAALALVTTGGDELGPNTWTEITLTVIGAGLAVAALLSGARQRAWGAATVALFGCLAALTAASVLWSVAPNSSWIEASRTLSYLAVFGGGAALARLWPGRWPALVGAVAGMATAISAYALLVKVFPGTFDPSDPVGRLRAPFEYWNATGLLGALGLAPCLWAGTRASRARWPRALAVPAISILLTVIVLSYSRGALLVAIVGLAFWFATVPLRLRGALVLALGAAGAAALSGFALATHALTHDQVALHSRTAAGHTFGLVLVAVLALTTAAGFFAASAMDRSRLSDRLRRRVAVGLLAAVAMLPLAGVVALAASSRGLTGEVGHVVSTLTSTHGGASNKPGRLIELGNTRGRYWSEGLKVGEHALLKGVGALGYGVAATRYTTDATVVPHAHSFVIQTFADFGLVGVAVMIALLGAWSLAAWRTVSGAAADERIAERVGLLTLVAVVITFGVHSAIDWTWFVPGTAVPALLCAGWLAGRGPSTAGVGREPQRRRLAASPGTGAAVIGIVAVTVLLVWAMWQPLRSDQANAAAIAAFANGKARAAIDDARAAASEDPVTVDPLFQLSEIYTAIGDPAAARGELLSAVHRQPQNPQTWLALGQFELQEHRPAAALGPLQWAHQLDLGSPEVNQALAQARAAVAGGA
jgi:O-Antigen ligase